MTVRPPQALAPAAATQTGLGVLEYELMAERADALGRHGQKVETALARLAEGVAGGCPPEERETLLDDAAGKVWAFMIQREICGLRSQKDLVRRYGIPPEVMARLGIVKPGQAG